MGAFEKISRLSRLLRGNFRLDDVHSSAGRVRACRYEEIESRQLMTADVHVGAVYFDPASGLDTEPNTIQITFEGGATGTELTHLVIDGSKDDGPLTFNDAIFDTAAGGLGAFGSSPLKIVSHDGFQVLGSQVADGGTSLALDFQGFQEGMKLVLSIDVDQVLFIDPAPGDVEVDAVDEGAEFQRSHFIASFAAHHYQDITTSTQFWDDFDSNFSAADAASDTHLDLPADRYSNPAKDQSVLTAGAVAVAPQPPLPNSLSGVVFDDANLNGHQDPGDAGIGGVKLTLFKFDGAGYVSTGLTTLTDSQGAYRFDNLPIGKFRVAESQPSGSFSVGAEPGNVAGQVRGVATSADLLSEIELLGGDDSVQNDFAEALPNSLGGYVKLDTFGDCETHPEDPPLEGVAIHLLDSSGKVVASTFTDEEGEYRFDNLPPGTYSVLEDQPAGYFNGDTHVGTAGGTLGDDEVSDVVLVSGVHATGYNFCETPPASICGFVYNDANNNGSKDPGEEGIADVLMVLTDADGRPTPMTVVTGADGYYCIKYLLPGTYGIIEGQPAGYLDGIDSAGTAGGVAQNPGDLILGAVLTPDFDAEDYDFGELLPASISGQVHARHGNDCDVADGATPLAGVAVQLLNANDELIAATVTDSQGNYRFENLLPGKYSVRELQPQGYFDGDADVGSAGGSAVDGGLISAIPISQGTSALYYDFCEIPPAGISGYVFQDGPPIVLDNSTDVPDINAIRDGKLTPDDKLLSGVTLELVDGVTGKPIMGSAALPGFYAANAPITTVTDIAGHYKFDGLAPGVYGVFDVKPTGYLTGIDTPGSLGGIVVSNLVVTDPAVLDQLVAKPSDDAIVGITLLADGQSTDNNFSVVETTGGIQFFVFPQPSVSPPGLLPQPLNPSIDPLFQSTAQFPFLLAPVLTRAGGAMYTWHLSVVDAGQPRAMEPEPIARLTSMAPEDLAWANGELSEGEWLLGSTPGGIKRSTRKLFGIRGAIPVTGDFNGDGKTEIGVFKDGQWFIDLNDNGVWDASDLWAKLGHKGDRPVTGDWDGDGKTDIGIFGPAWPRDPRAIKHEPGLPDSHNENTNVHKNIPRPQERTAMGSRTMKLTSSGKPRADLIDHVFLYGTAGDYPAVGDWNGDGTHTIAVFRNGVWHRDADGDGRWSKADAAVQFGQPGDVPVVGDFNGDGIDELGVFRNGTWLIDMNGNGQIDANDQVFQMGGPGDKPVVGDWDGDGKSEPGIYHAAAAPLAKAVTDSSAEWTNLLEAFEL